MLAVPILLVIAVSLSGASPDDAFRRLAMAALLLINGPLLVLLWRRPVSLALVGLWVFVSPAVWAPGRLLTWEVAPSTRPDSFGLLIAALAWFGVVFALAFLVFGTRRGAKVALGTDAYHGATVSAVGGMLSDRRSIRVVVFLAAGDFVLIPVVWVLARSVERLAVARARAELLELQATADPLTGIANRRRADEEVVILAPQTSPVAACALAERCRMALTVRGDQDPETRITASFGVATCDVHEDDARSRIRRADLALYEAKSEGRDRVVGRTEPTDAGGLDSSPRRVPAGEGA